MPSLVCPTGRAASFDPSHIAASRCDFTAVPTGGGMINLRRGGIVGVPTGTVVPTVADSLGSTINYNVDGAVTKWAGYSAVRFGFSTIAAILLCNSFGGTQWIFCDNSNSTGNGLNTNTTGLLQWTMFGVVALSSSITLAAGTPYFVVASQNAAVVVNYVALNLKTGKILTSTSASQNPSQSGLDGNYAISPPFNSASARAKIAAVMHSSTYLPMSTLLAWAADPWSFWYPPRRSMRVAPSAAFPFWAVRNNDFVIGTGVQ